MTNSGVVYVCALACEAKGLIDFYRLKKVCDKPFAVFAATGKPQLEVLVSGIGAYNMAAAVGWFAGRSAQTNPCWLNIGTAGHSQMEVGELALVHQSSDVLQEVDFYPPMVASWKGPTVHMLSYNSPCTDYPQGAAVDMEASAFFAVANKFCTAELVQSLKVISDNTESGIGHLNAAFVAELMQPHSVAIDQFAQALQAIRPALELSNELEAGVEHLHCTVSQRHQFLELCEKLTATNDLNQKLISEVAQLASMAQVLAHLQQQLFAKPPVATLVNA